jgi:predicted MPP superfamily phosphohydrolase
MIDPFWRYLPDLVAGALAVVTQSYVVVRMVRRFPSGRPWIGILGVAAVLWVALSFLFCLPHIYRRWPLSGPLAWIRAAGMLWAMALVGGVVIERATAWLLGWHTTRRPRGRSAAVDLDRRHALRLAAVSMPAAVLGYGAILERRTFRLREVDIRIPGLAHDLDGLRLVQITDIHMSPFFSAQDLEYAIGIANETKAHVALMTGDLITQRGDPLEECIRLLQKVKADTGLLGCLGNHEISADCEDHATAYAARRGMRILRSCSEQLRFGNASINFAGVDYQRRGKPYLKGAGRLMQPGMLNVLLSHNPDVFPSAAAMGYDLTIAGHTHGGQVTVEILHQYLNIARFYTPYVYGHYERGGRSVYVSRGLGTVGVPVRVGAPPEVALIRLCAS